jgi:hypothetical protein
MIPRRMQVRTCPTTLTLGYWRISSSYHLRSYSLLIFDAHDDSSGDSTTNHEVQTLPLLWVLFAFEGWNGLAADVGFLHLHATSWLRGNISLFLRGGRIYVVQWLAYVSAGLQVFGY